MSPEMTDVADDLPTNRGRWGLEDELGTLNFITEGARVRGVEQARDGRVVSLAMPLTPAVVAGGGPVPQGMTAMPAPVLQMMSFTGSPPSVLADVLVINTHHFAMTHVDALVHVPVGDEVYPGIPIRRAVARGTVKHGSTTAFAAGIATRGVFLDLAPGSRLDPGHEVTSGDLEQAERRSGVRVESGDALVVRGGWTVYKHLAEPVPAITLDAVRWMAAREVSLYAGDIGDRPPGAGWPLPLHEVALARLGLPLIDCADVSLLATTCSELARWTFLFVLAAMPIQGATGVPVNPLAIF